MTKEVLRHLGNYIESERKKGNKNSFSTLENITAEDISFGEEPIYYFAYIQGNATGEGSSYYQGTETHRTVNMDFTTDEYLFIKGHEGAARQGLSLYYLKENQTIPYHKESEIKDLAYFRGFDVIRQNLTDLNFSGPGPYRVNRSKVMVTKGPFKYPIKPIFATVSKKGKQITLGYIYEMNEETYILIEPSGGNIEVSKKTGCLLAIAGYIIVSLIIWLIQKFLMG